MRRSRFVAGAGGALAAFALALAGPAAPAHPAAPVAHPGVVSEDPVAHTPHVLDGQVWSIAVVGRRVVVAGDFTRVREHGDDEELRRSNIFAYDHRTGAVDPRFRPEVDGTVRKVVAGPGGSVILGGSFTEVNGEPSRGLARLDAADGEAAAEFGATTDGTVTSLAEHGGELYAGGSFTAVGGRPRTGLARLDAETGAVDEGFALELSHPRGESAPRLSELALSPDGSRLVVNGDFQRVDGHTREQIAMLDVTGADARVTGWATRDFRHDCGLPHLSTNMRQMAFSPDGSYFVVVTTGNPVSGGELCYSASRWETRTDRAGLHPTWVNHTGGHSLYAVAATGPAVYVGGHQRWHDNAGCFKEACPGSVERSGIAALDPATGRALPWNPGRDRGHGVLALTAVPDGLLVGSDTERLAGEFHARLGMFPLG
ncbi:delta-60 repeat domain-containing protein [Allonocardiopsis opalescens]|uniref:Beta-propeller uncharacterized protein DUF5122 n=1 Tax=Allonocardiopsis opalescens TaxID=1144618 RepID=A0A2T0Q7S8_9ACTN|nr:delta-60 repeat domain-containing protein [Allonocardiopsis opalescens]PRX99910.1 beta-propeller uncharacterized protein DUF5122 [Allonocardiopsis opalescens]